MPGVPHIPAGHPPIAGALEAAELARAENVEYSCCKWFWPQAGHPAAMTAVLSLARTNFSNLSPQDSQRYS